MRRAAAVLVAIFLPLVGCTADPADRSGAQVCGQDAWAHCLEALWLERVIESAGFTVTGDADGYLILTAGPYEIRAWTDDDPVLIVLDGYERRKHTDAFGNGRHLVWDAQETHVYLSSEDDRSINEIPTHIVDRLIAESREVPASADLTGAKP